MARLTALLLLVACGPDLSSNSVGDNGDFVDETDTEAPVVEHSAITDTQPFGEDVAVDATVTDVGGGVLFVNLYYKSEIDGSNDWHKKGMSPVDDVYTGYISGDDEHGGGMDYYIEAVDKSQNTTWAPDDGEGDPYHFRLAD